MAELRPKLAEVGYADPATILQSGNIIVTAELASEPTADLPDDAANVRNPPNAPRRPSRNLWLCSSGVSLRSARCKAEAPSPASSKRDDSSGLPLKADNKRVPGCSVKLKGGSARRSLCSKSTTSQARCPLRTTHTGRRPNHCCCASVCGRCPGRALILLLKTLSRRNLWIRSPSLRSRRMRGSAGIGTLPGTTTLTRRH